MNKAVYDKLPIKHVAPPGYKHVPLDDWMVIFRRLTRAEREDPSIFRFSADQDIGSAIFHNGEWIY